jgi:hypothetical protein
MELASAGTMSWQLHREGWDVTLQTGDSSLLLAPSEMDCRRTVQLSLGLYRLDGSARGEMLAGHPASFHSCTMF